CARDSGRHAYGQNRFGVW
nr:immunoglobulin heavy chain junction region [Macaca mulatta]MOV42703.1 immunoglobulin heavy chain junction region [Macaca mulatta]MOV42970.1 immunoglobulin heavy chain junction region [Macaca mulatta]MOV44975.1 immunoglobulin heavy chain junction region [Macaca mulatta]MOV46821.1 immunoglobulin heavy chain junction region [Macaca mulatta]